MLLNTISCCPLCIPKHHASFSFFFLSPFPFSFCSVFSFPFFYYKEFFFAISSSPFLKILFCLVQSFLLPFFFLILVINKPNENQPRWAWAMGHVKKSLTDDFKTQKVLGLQDSKPNSNDIWVFLQFLKMQKFNLTY